MNNRTDCEFEGTITAIQYLSLKYIMYPVEECLVTERFSYFQLEGQSHGSDGFVIIGEVEQRRRSFYLSS